MVEGREIIAVTLDKKLMVLSFQFTNVIIELVLELGLSLGLGLGGTAV